MVPVLPACETMKQPKRSLQGTVFGPFIKSDGQGMHSHQRMALVLCRG